VQLLGLGLGHDASLASLASFGDSYTALGMRFLAFATSECAGEAALGSRIAKEPRPQQQGWLAGRGHQALREWKQENPGLRYPDSEERRKLAALCKLTESQVASWFVKERQTEAGGLKAALLQRNAETSTGSGSRKRGRDEAECGKEEESEEESESEDEEGDGSDHDTLADLRGMPAMTLPMALTLEVCVDHCDELTSAMGVTFLTTPSTRHNHRRNVSGLSEYLCSFLPSPQINFTFASPARSPLGSSCFNFLSARSNGRSRGIAAFSPSAFWNPSPGNMMALPTPPPSKVRFSKSRFTFLTSGSCVTDEDLSLASSQL
jgi:hypothetical protein